ncbi:2'-5' RNA ligase family protein [Kitasatospora sp. YST-16]|uniref:2'-5' RNA ligase family protein n=1 Tax=Kitasatospora sp. YST-16 TaxID=2998080 RepID=UPI0022842ABC|nr:2'-5' RNA ligase family protein [Kitasatospora sp. YST-16]WAL74519.1 2'-5' RNA ligase family protein [Kitasatospora sp. YST-16]WNW40580.1 2'-5' RNA ligase family protein [Streptomyces sp. Li-HN-5-13]
MEKFEPRFQGDRWPDRHGPGSGARALHVYAVPDLTAHPELAQLVAECHKAMADFPVTLMTTTLHSTVEMVADTTSDEITVSERADLAAALHRHLAGTAPIEVTVGSPVANKAGAYLDLHPDQELVALRERVRAAISEVRGPNALRHRGGRPHITLGYAWNTASSDALQTALRRISPSHAPLTISSVQLLDVLWQPKPRPDDRTAWEISWNPVATIPLASAR